MLVLSRKIGQRIMLTGGITITVMEIRNNGEIVRLGIEAPQDISIWREELSGPPVVPQAPPPEPAKPEVQKEDQDSK